jgi:hypothetical protein
METFTPNVRKKVDEFKGSPRDIVKQLEWCGYECEGGKLPNNVAFLALKELVSEDRFCKAKMYRIKLEDYVVKVVCEHCFNAGEVDPHCTRCGGNGVHRKTKHRWVVVRRLEDIDNIDRDSNGNLRYWTSKSDFFEESSKLVHFTYEDALRECRNRNKTIE